MKFHESKAIIKYGPDLQIVALIDETICQYYRSLIPKYYYPKPPKHKSHITVMRLKKETPVNLEFWNKHEGRKISFSYEPLINFSGKYFWLDAQSQEIGDIREELGVPRYRDDGIYQVRAFNSYHITIANLK
jgi:hypothetical protein